MLKPPRLNKTADHQKGKNMKEFFDALKRFDMNALFRAETTNGFIQFFRYIFVGGIAFVADAGALWLCEKFMHYLIAAAIAFVFGLVVNYVLSVCFVFSDGERTTSRTAEFIIYAVIGVIGLGLTELIMWLLSKIVAAAIVLVWNFVARKKFIYTKK